jgi:hypothetical protein
MAAKSARKAIETGDGGIMVGTGSGVLREAEEVMIKAKGRFPFRDFAPKLSDFSKTWSGFQTTTFVIPKSLGIHELAPVFPSLFRYHTRGKNFLVAALGEGLCLWIRHNLRHEISDRRKYRCD